METLEKVLCTTCNNENCTCDFNEWMDVDYATQQEQEEVNNDN